MANFHIIYYETKDGKCPIEEFIESKDTKNQAKIFAFLDLLREQGPVLPRPYADILTDGIHELRIKLSGDQVRILYFFTYKEFIILTHAFRKNSQKVPKSEISKAINIREDFLKRYTEEKLRKEFKK